MRSEIRIWLAGQDEGRFTRDGDTLVIDVVDRGEAGRNDDLKAVYRIKWADFQIVRALMMEKPTC